MLKTNDMSLSNWRYIEKYGGYHLAWETVKKGIPIILGAAIRPEWTDQWVDHAYLMYGYDAPTDMFLGTMCWGRPDTSSILFSYYVGAWGSYCFGLEPTSYAKYKPLPKVFEYNDKFYTGPEITDMIKKS